MTDSSLPCCPICFDQFEGLANIAACACGHTFHFDCIVNWTKNSLVQGQPASCPTCMRPFKAKPASGIVTQLFFSFDQSSCPPKSKVDENQLKQLRELSETLLKKAEIPEDQIEAFSRKLEFQEAKIDSLQNSKRKLENQLKASEALVMSLHEENIALKNKTTVLNEIVNLVTTAGLTTGSQYSNFKAETQVPLQATIPGVEDKVIDDLIVKVVVSEATSDFEVKKKQKKQKKKKEKSDAPSPEKLTPSEKQPSEGALAMNVASSGDVEDNFLIPRPMRSAPVPDLEIPSKFAAPHGEAKKVFLPSDLSKAVEEDGIIKKDDHNLIHFSGNSRDHPDYNNLDNEQPDHSNNNNYRDLIATDGYYVCPNGLASSDRVSLCSDIFLSDDEDVESENLVDAAEPWPKAWQAKPPLQFREVAMKPPTQIYRPPHVRRPCLVRLPPPIPPLMDLSFPR